MTWIVIILAMPLLLPTTILVVEILFGIWPASYHVELPPVTGRTVIMIPAHNEEVGIARTLEAIIEEKLPNFSILVVADNCTDSTAVKACAAGAVVIERSDAINRGKGYALSFGRDHLRNGNAPDCVIIIDADTIADPNCLTMLAARALAEDRPVQASYIFEPKASDPPVVKFSAAGILIKNLVRQLGSHRLGAPAILTGSGMAFPWQQFVALPLENGDLAEDLMMGVASTLNGNPPVFLAQAVVRSAASSQAGTTTQRRRWESGFIDTAKLAIIPLLRKAVARRQLRLAWLAMHLATPPFVLLIAVDLFAVIVLGILTLFGIGQYILYLLLSMIVAAVSSALLAICLAGYAGLLSSWHALPFYILWKLKLSIGVLVRRERRWLRTERDQG